LPFFFNICSGLDQDFRHTNLVSEHKGQNNIRLGNSALASNSERIVTSMWHLTTPKHDNEEVRSHNRRLSMLQQLQRPFIIDVCKYTSPPTSILTIYCLTLIGNSNHSKLILMLLILGLQLLWPIEIINVEEYSTLLRIVGWFEQYNELNNKR
jgi:hypothetical protein